MKDFDMGRYTPLAVVLLFCIGLYIFSQFSRISANNDAFKRDLKTSYPQLPYEAIYRQDTGTGEGLAVVDSNGRGQVRIETYSPTSKGQSVTIVDFIAGKKYFLKDDKKTYYEGPLTSMGLGAFDEQMFVSSKAQDLGERVINGRKCRGYKTQFPVEDAKQIESWFDASTGVLMVSITQDSKYILSKYIPREPKPGLFIKPADYKPDRIKIF